MTALNPRSTLVLASGGVETATLLHKAAAAGDSVRALFMDYGQRPAAMERLGAARDHINAVIGPAISQAAYEVGPEFIEGFLADDPDTARFFADGCAGKYQFDLPGYGLHRLRRAGVGHAEWTRHCTYADPARFYSYRRATHAGEADYGRLVSAIRL